MNNITNFLDFKNKKEDIDSQETFSINPRKSKPSELDNFLDTLWWKIHCGEELVYINSDEAGKIHYLTKAPEKKSPDNHCLTQHVNFFIGYINEYCSSMIERLSDEYEKFIEENEVSRIIGFKQKHS